MNHESLTLSESLAMLDLQPGSRLAFAEKNNVTLDQAHAMSYIQSILKRLTPETKALITPILANKETALPALTRVAGIRNGDCHIDRTERAVAAVLAGQTPPV